MSDISYFSQYPNNLLLVRLFALIKKVDMYFGVLDVNNGTMCILCVQCIISSLTGFLLFKIVRNFIGYGGAWCAWFCYLVLVGSSGWLLIPYSDSIGLLFPVLLLYLYQQTQDGSAALRAPLCLKWLLMGVLSCLGYHIKPQIIIVLIAIILTECMCLQSAAGKSCTVPFFNRNQDTALRSRLRRLACMLFFALAGLLITAFLYNILMKDITEQLDPEKRFGITHYVMMGLNSENNGVYLYSDTVFSESFSTVSDRNAANVEVIGQRLQDMGISGLAEHLAKKVMTNYGDGVFAWKFEGDFFAGIYEPKNSFLSPLLRNIIGGDGKMNLLTETVRQMVWLCILAASLGLAGYQKSADNVLSVVVWSIMGLTLFELLFEARARYLYIYVPFYIVAGIMGAGKIRAFLKQSGCILGKKVIK